MSTEQPQADTRKWYRVKFRERRNILYRVYAENAEAAQDMAADKCDDGEEPFDVLNTEADIYSCEVE